MRFVANPGQAVVGLCGCAVMLCIAGGFAKTKGPDQAAAVQSSALKIVVIEGEAAVNIIQQKTAVAPVVEVRDRNDLPVSGAAVTFTISGGNSATFAGGVQTLTVTTNAAGRAAVSALNPLGTGAFQINVQAAFQGQAAAATIAQTNVLTAAEATAASGSGTAAGSTSAAAGGGGGGGLSGGAIAGIAGGAAAGAAAAAVGLNASGGSDTSLTITPSPTGGGIREITEFAFSTSGGDPGTTYSWTFGDGATSTGNPVRHVYSTEGSFQVTVNASGPKGEQTGATNINVRSLTGTWKRRLATTPCVPTPPETSCVSAQFFVLTQQGATITGQWIDEFMWPGLERPSTTQAVVGTLVHPRTLNFTEQGSCQHVFTGMIEADVQTISGTSTKINPNPICDVGRTAPFTWNRQ